MKLRINSQTLKVASNFIVISTVFLVHIWNKLDHVDKREHMRNEVNKYTIEGTNIQEFFLPKMSFAIKLLTHFVKHIQTLPFWFDLLTILYNIKWQFWENEIFPTAFRVDRVDKLKKAHGEVKPRSTAPYHTHSHLKLDIPIAMIV